MFENILKFLKERWVLQLHQEYENICYQYGLKLKKPILVIDGLKTSWGFWDKNRRIILISEELIKKYSWEIVLQVLKHEMAHQIVSDIFRVEEGHGNYFKQACKMLGLEDEYCRASISMEEQFVHWKQKKSSAATSAEEEILLNKIQKLLNLAQSSNEHEAALAMEKVQEIYEKYNIQKIKQGQTQEYYTLTINFKKKRIPITHSIAAYILQQHFFVHVIFSSLYDSMEDSNHKTIEVMGSRQNVLMAEYVFYFLIERLELLWENYSKQKNLLLKYKLSFQQGILEGFLKKLDIAKEIRAKVHVEEETKSMPQAQLNALIRLNDAKLQEYVRFKYPKVAKKNSSSSGVYTEHFKQGVEEGKKINLHRPISHSSKNPEKKLLLT